MSIANGTPSRATFVALLPGLGASVLWLGPGTALNLGICALVLLPLAHRSGHGPWAPLVAACVLAFTIPPASPWWLIAMCGCAVWWSGFRRQDRLGVNPAMLSAALAFLLLPQCLAIWPAGTATPDVWLHQLHSVFSSTCAFVALDGNTGATALVAMAQRAPLTISELQASSLVLGRFGGAASEWLALAWLIGGLCLLYWRVISWHMPVGCMAGVLLTAAIFYDGDGAFGGAPPLMHLFAGGTMLIAWFVLPEPATRPRSAGLQVLVGLIAGALICALRETTGGAERAAFVVLSMNALTPALEHVLGRMSSMRRRTAT